MSNDMQAYDTSVDLLHLSGNRLTDVRRLDEFYHSLPSNVTPFVRKSLFINTVISSCRKTDVRICPLCFSVSNVFGALSKTDVIVMSEIFHPYPTGDEAAQLFAASMKYAVGSRCDVDTDRTSGIKTASSAGTPTQTSNRDDLLSGHPSLSLQVRMLELGLLAYEGLRR